MVNLDNSCNEGVDASDDLLLSTEQKQAGIRGQWQQESPAREYLELVKCCHDTDCNEPMMKKGFTASESGTWEE